MRKRALAAMLLSASLATGATGCKIDLGKPKATSTAPSANASKPLGGPVHTNHIQQDWADKKIVPTAIILHWQANDGTKDAEGLAADLNSQATTFDPKLTSNQPHPKNGHTGVQFGVSWNGRIDQLTPTPNTFARHATCANDWAVGIEIAGSDGGKTGPYIGNNTRQFKSVVALVKLLMKRYHIPATNVVGKGAHSGRGIISHRQVDAVCTWKDGVHFGSGKTDVDPTYLNRVLKAVGGK